MYTICDQMVKKIKIRKHRQRVSYHSEESLPQKFAEIYTSKIKDLDTAFDSAIKDIPEIFRKYSAQDIASSLFVSSMWLPNISSPIKHQLLAAVFAAMKPQEFSTHNAITSYDDFKKLMQVVYPLLPTFLMLEDYVPEADWGQIKFYHDEKNYKIFYGNELSNVCDYLMLFQMVYIPFDQGYIDQSGRSPAMELQYTLQLQDNIISGIMNQPLTEDLKDIIHGHIEIPSQEFWASAIAFYNSYDPRRTCPAAFLKNYSIQLGLWPQKYLQSETFRDMASAGKVLPVNFVEYEGQYFPILPRRYSAILFDSWSQIYEKYHDRVGRNDMPLSISIGGGLHKYVKARVKSSFLQPLVSAVTEKGVPHEILFHTSFISKDRLILVYVTNPAYSRQKTEKELEKVATKLHEAMSLIGTPPLTLALNLDEKNAVFQGKQKAEMLKPSLFIVVPQVSTEIYHLSLPSALPGTIVFMDSLLGIIDELENVEMFASFLEYLEEYGNRIRRSMLSLLDIFGSFKSSMGVLIEGASQPDMISLDPHWGTHLRYETLSKFWAIYPQRHFFDHPRSWDVTQETGSRIRLESRGYLGAALYCLIDSTHIFLNAPFREMSYEQASIANLLMECLEDMISRNKNIIAKHEFFKVHDQFQVLFFPISLVAANDTFKHLKHLDPESKYWRSDYGFPGQGRYGIRVVFNDKLLSEAFAATKDRTLEVELCLEILDQLNNIIPDQNILLIHDELKKQKTGKPRFTIQIREKRASFPEFISPEEPALGHFKRARKRIAELARERKLSAGYYTLEIAKLKLNALRASLVKEIDTEINKFDFTLAIPFLLERIDALTDQYERTTGTIKQSIEHEVDYNREEGYAKRHDEFITLHKNYRYLIEKFVQLEPKGQMILEKDQFQYFIAFIDWLHVFYSASDSLHYGIHAAGMKVTDDFTVEVDYDSSLEAMENKFAEEEASIKLGLVGNPDDKVVSPRPTSELLAALDTAFKQDYGFAFKSMISVLKILTHWPTVNPNTMINSYYSAIDNEICDTVHQAVGEIPKEEVIPILDFLTLKSSEVVRLIGDEQVCPDVPVWEYKKRYARYNLRPLVKVDNKYYWGPYSTMKSGLIWLGSLSDGALPADLQSPAIKAVISSEKKLIEDALEDKAFDIVKRYTQYARSNVWLHKLNKSAGHPQALGDFDVLSFHQEKNVILNIECKDITPPHCLKDAKTLREAIFGEPGKNQGHFSQINKRNDYLAMHLIEIMKTLGWPIEPQKMPKIISIYLTQITYWWTRFSPIPVNTIFVRVDMLSNFIETL